MNPRKIRLKIKKKNSLLSRNFFLKNFFSFAKKNKRRKKISAFQKHYYKKFIRKGKKKFIIFLNRKKAKFYKNRKKKWLMRKGRRIYIKKREKKVPIKPPKKLLLFNNKIKNYYHAFYESSVFSAARFQQLNDRLKKNPIKKFWGAFIKKGIRLNKIYYYVRQKFRLLTGRPVDLFYKISLELLRPTMYYKPRRFGAFIHLIPRLISRNLGFSLAKRFLIRSISKRKEPYLGDRIVNELLDIVNLKSLAFQFKKDVYSEIIENRVYLRRRRRKKFF